MRAEALHLDRIPSPLGDCLLVFDDSGALRALEWQDFEPRMRQLLARHWGAEGRGHSLSAATAPRSLRDAMSRYFAGDSTAVDALNTRSNGTPFQQQVWQALRAIPAGRTMSYGALARQIGRPGAVRAIGIAVGANPISVVVPCHRVIGSDGSLTGYAGGLARKRWLLAHEGASMAGV